MASKALVAFMSLARNIFCSFERCFPRLGTTVRRLYRRLWLAREVATGRYRTKPRHVVHFADYERSATGETIPLVWNVTWKTASLPAAFQPNWDTIRALHAEPRWSHRIWTDADIDAFVTQHYPHRRAAYDALPKHIMRIDLFRYMLMHVHGGIYSDLDVRMFKPIDDLLADCSLLLAAESDRITDGNFIAQHFLASVPGHPFWEALLRAALDKPLDVIREYKDPVETTGPTFVTRIWRSCPSRFGAKVVTRVHLCPPSMLAHPEFTIPKQCYGIHECTGTWR